jgi:hypothetical protein
MSLRPIKNPGWRTGVAGMNQECNRYLYDSNFFHKYQALSRFIFLQLLIGSHFKPEPSLAIDKAIVALKGAVC